MPPSSTGPWWPHCDGWLALSRSDKVNNTIYLSSSRRPAWALFIWHWSQLFKRWSSPMCKHFSSLCFYFVGRFPLAKANQSPCGEDMDAAMERMCCLYCNLPHYPEGICIITSYNLLCSNKNSSFIRKILILNNFIYLYTFFLISAFSFSLGKTFNESSSRAFWKTPHRCPI